MRITILYITSILIWGSTWFAIKFQLGHIDPILSIAYRFLLASVILFFYCLMVGLRLRFRWKDHAFIALQGFLSFTVSYWFVYMAEERVTSGLVAVIASSLILANIVNSALFLKTRINPLVVVGGLIGIAGIVLIFWHEVTAITLTDKNIYAIALVGSSTFFYSLGNITVERNRKHRLPVIQTNMFSMAYAAIIMFALAAILRKPFRFDMSLPYMGSLLYLAVLGSVVAFYCYFSLIGEIGADKAAYAAVVIPMIALFLSTLFESYRWTLLACIGIVFLVTGNFFVINKKTVAQRKALF